jgi:hypothetical protein
MNCILNFLLSPLWLIAFIIDAIILIIISICSIPILLFHSFISDVDYDGYEYPCIFSECVRRLYERINNN